ncbi:hypothetical protein Z959_03975 [Clostridium novyi B str. ATCC 27606]|uniref:Uncharacterized protein n=2 Tax=Clostridium TaxID=1485 RepID=A0AA40ISB6_CLONO|nr:MULTISPECIES: hypothetical protein [Clostridium]KEI12738.1 hypothetical protein Z959_03975 [Clostridium novyi B str. ATCC 27606]KEI14771.1 hypothetical protein Z958_10085 [Clostridium novyi B str. NCTC 9691]KEI16423.1 hypothetical protein Z960_09685 [Clostridium haemolyticum NCTC 9693]KGN04750.1 hypothetical protein Z961_01025 [Clostridium haemolyticum NCTC 8350]OOB76439.1 hypothetical protein AXF41_02745 [Clostridium haemolyticum]
MYKETVARKKISSLVVIVILLAVSIVLSDISRSMEIGHNELGEALIVLLMAFIFMLILIQIYKCSIRYKYSIIADELIIYKIKGCREEVMENIKIKNIQSIEKRNKFYFIINALMSKKYIGLNLANDLYTCKYKSGYTNKKFYFEPSSKLVDKLHLLRQSE